MGMKKERRLVQHLLTEDIDIDEFVSSADLESANSRLLVPLIQRLQLDWPDEIPEPYSRFICNLCKPTSVASFLQVTSDEPLQILRLFCEQALHIRSPEQQDKLKLILRELPALWPNLMDILEIECSEFLPDELARVVLKMIEIRRGTFRNAAQRNDEDYIPWPAPEQEDPTQCYPAWPIFRYPKKYDVNSKQDVDFCEKSFGHKNGFAFGSLLVTAARLTSLTGGS